MQLKLSYPLRLPFTIGQKFGENTAINPKTGVSFYKEMGMLGHNGVDFPTADGTPVYATHDGVVTFAGDDGSAGLGVVIRTNDQFDYKDGKAYFKTIYWHLKVGGILVTAGQQVKRGQMIAKADNTGMSTGSHLHFGIKPVYQGEPDWIWANVEQSNGYFGAIDPMPFFDGTYPTATKSPEFLALAQAIKDYQVSKGLMDFANQTDLSRINIGPRTLIAYKLDQNG